MKRIVLCTDGTWNTPDQEDRGKRKPTNVVKVARSILPNSDDGISQIVFYSDGVGTNWGLDRIAGGGFGLGLSANIVDAYQFLVNNFVVDDEIYLFGFSRGAYTARSLAGLINTIGILPKDHAYYTPDAYSLYRDQVPEDVAANFRTNHKAISTQIKFVGVWDTVGALGIPVGLFERFNRRYSFHEVGLTPNIENAFHALSIDEQRKPFAPSLWQKKKDSQQILEQVWFAGVHSNIGGGYSKDGLANISLHWMKDKAKSCDLQFDEDFLRYYRPWMGDELRDSMSFKYKIFGKHLRPIGVTDHANESIHDTVKARMKHLKYYRPKNVMPRLSRVDLAEIK